MDDPGADNELDIYVAGDGGHFEPDVSRTDDNQQRSSVAVDNAEKLSVSDCRVLEAVNKLLKVCVSLVTLLQ